MTLAIILLALAPGFAWLFFYLKEDVHPEPKRLIVSVFIAGMAFAFFALVLQVLASPVLAGLGVAVLTPISLLVLSLIEEVTKFWAAYFVVHKSAEFNEPVDAMIYMVVAALGFATVENIGALHGGGSQTALISSAFETASLRFVGATLLHSLSSAIVGYYWAISVREFHARKPLVLGICIATALHAAFNYLILGYGSVVYPVIFLTIVGFFVLADFESLRRKKI
ncbi:PrsW family intramembrane metalloprotease [Candidatus Parcubacteria bacterium]|nr:MAG: PrsW family intramembrane metalloprotease [Candidatus Parcubacteria bacterium]